MQQYIDRIPVLLRKKSKEKESGMIFAVGLSFLVTFVRVITLHSHTNKSNQTYDVICDLVYLTSTSAIAERLRCRMG